MVISDLGHMPYHIPFLFALPKKKNGSLYDEFSWYFTLEL